MAKPEIRLKGFEGEWKEVLLSKIATMHARIGWQNLRKDEFLSKGEYYLITGTDFDDGRVDYKTCHFVEKVRYDQDKNIQVKNGSILITKDGTLGKVAFVENLNKPATLNAGVFNVMCKNNDVDSRFLFQYLRSPLLMDYVNLTATGGTIKHLNQNILVNFPVQLPLIEEQVFLGTYFQHLDNIVHNTIKEIASLKQMKSASLISMFPQAGETTPRVRFKGFKDGWKTVKIMECLEEVNVRNYPIQTDFVLSLTIKDGVLPYSEKGHIGNRAKEDHTLYKIAYPDTIVLNSMNILIGAIGMCDYFGCVSPVYYVFKCTDIANRRFIFDIMSNRQFQRELRQIASGMMEIRQKVPINELMEKKILIPSIDEQQRIADYFRSLDKQISLQEQRLEKLKQIKAACLDKMFV